MNQDLRILCDIRQKSLASVIDSIRKSLDPANPDGVSHARPIDIIQMHYALVNVYAYRGEMEKAIEQWQAAYAIATAQLAGAMAELEEVLGTAYLHQSEMENDVYRHPKNQCIFPPVAQRRSGSGLSAHRSESCACFPYSVHR